MNKELQEIVLDGVKYIKKGSTQEEAEKFNGLNYVIIRGSDSGVFAGYLKKEEGRRIELLKSTRLWYWDGAATLHELALSGTKLPQHCKFTVEVQEIIILDVIEIIHCTENARKSIYEVTKWTA